ncbi:unnamed protein product [Leptidea sinapis]|uniref:Centromere/kinetochore protein zw10 homolog n=1 Tax=Leptidea sinapis TaxID=189913 RepID=A0A5E4R636_9NEOP|nr:unnamed protein product [Leptidea sinapis]
MNVNQSQLSRKTDQKEDIKMTEYNINVIIQSIVCLNDGGWTPSNVIPLVQKEIEKIHAETIQSVCNNSFDVPAVLSEANALRTESQLLIEEMKTCKHEIEANTMAEVLKSIESHDLISKEIDSVNFAHSIVKDAILCGKYLKEFEEGKKLQSFTKAVESVYDLLLFVDKPKYGFDQLEIYNNAKVTGQLIMENLVHDLTLEWDKMVCLNKSTEENRTTVSVAMTMGETALCIDVLNALDKCKRLDEKVSQMSQFLLDDILVPIMNESCLIEEHENGSNLRLVFDHKVSTKPQYDEVIKNMTYIFSYISKFLDFEFKNNTTLMILLGRNISSEFTDLIVENVFIHTVPSNITQLYSYDQVTTAIEKFQGFLSTVHFFPEEGYTLLSYMKDIDSLFAERASKYILESARTIMLKDLSTAMSIGVEKIPENSDKLKSEPTDVDVIEALDVLDKTIPNSLLFFPRCMISKSAQELLDLVIETMEQAVQSSDIASRKLYNTARLIFELYDAVVPYHHEIFLLSIPQYVALFHNNCMYLAHNLQTLGDKWSNLMDGSCVNYAISFLDLVQKMRNLGYKLIATLVNMFLEELIHRVCTVEDISVEMATQLTYMYNIVVQKTQMDVEKYVVSWAKFKELIFILGASLRDLESHWNDGNGPLAVYFSVEELRSLIKALFQNTQFRANFLSKIK